jgi:anaerobic selenocysteine-containing dehydrogenase
MRSEGQFNTVVYEEEDVYRGQERRDVVLMNGKDIKRMGLAVDQLTNVSSETGVMPNIRVREFDIPEGNCAMYYPEANVLIPRVADARSRTPAFKSAVVRIAPARANTGDVDRDSGPGTEYAAAGSSKDRMNRC